MRLGVLCSGNGSNFENIVRSCNKHEVVLMIHNKKECGAAKRANKLGIPHCYISHKNEDQIIQLLTAWRVDLVVLAGWMKVLSSDFIKSFDKKIINIHPSLLPKYKGLNAIERAFENKDDVTGCTVHYVTEELDGGEIIMQEEVSILDDDTIESLTQHVHEAEYRILPEAINYVVN
tara:strand:- start:624 stop:1151 length:528 start_codon:yes stop_codon:yes gene_type:complete